MDEAIRRACSIDPPSCSSRKQISQFGRAAQLNSILSNPTIAEMAEDLAVFTDLGTDAPSVEERPDKVVRMVRNGEPTTLRFSASSDAILEEVGSQSIKHASFRALLASDRYGNLRSWVTKQRASISMELEAVGNLIAIDGSLNDSITKVNLSDVDQLLAAQQQMGSTRVLLIDGPAGIGKTQFILSLAARRVETFATERRPLILHVQSRGRTLSYLYDLIAFSLQRMRLEVTYDQAPILAKYGLITIAIDGFDELADPDGYGSAWAQVSDLIQMLRGSGSLVLAGRETFIGRDRILADISSLRANIDEVLVLTLQPPSKGTAIGWLRTQGWTVEQINSVEGFLEPSSIALRPFFLKTLSDQEMVQKVASSTSASILSILMEAMLEREMGKFGESVERELSLDDRRRYLKNLLGEAARDMAESASSSISDATLAWLVDVALPREVTEDVRRILKARSHAVAFFANDDRPGYRKFFHEKFYEYFLAATIVDMVIKRESGRVLSRTILGSSFLETFGDVISTGIPADTAREFASSALKLLRDYPPVDRTRKNLAALAIASLSIADAIGDYEIVEVEIDEARFAGTASGGKLRDVVVNQFDCRGGNIAAVDLSKVVVLTLIADTETLLSNTFPCPTRVRDVSRTSTLSSPDEVNAWIVEHLENPPAAEVGLVPDKYRDHAAIKLLQKACRMRQYWLRRNDDVYTSRILDDEYWPLVERCLESNNLLTVESRPASGTDARFVHVRRGDVILAENRENEDVRQLYADLVNGLESEGP
jgi:hypothetical protein